MGTFPSLDGRRWSFLWLPGHCLVCGLGSAAGRDLCGACADDVAANRICCARCALPLPIPAALCGRCLRRAPAFDAAWSPFRYEAPLDRLVARCKFGRDLAAGRVLAELWADAARDRPLPGALMPVPLHAARLRERGYNQVVEMARGLARQFGVPLDLRSLRRHRATPAQSGLDAKTRRRNLRNAFAVRPGATLPPRVVLLDDVMTTGATLDACARALRRAGVDYVEVWALARAPARGG